MKKAIALMLCLAMVTVTLSGCTEAELGFLSRLQNVRQSVDGTFSNTVEIDIKKSVLQDFLESMSDQLQTTYHSTNEPAERAAGALTAEGQEAELEELLIRYGEEDTLSEAEYERLEELLYDEPQGPYREQYEEPFLLGGIYPELLVDLADEALYGLEATAAEDEDLHIQLQYTGERQLGPNGGLRVSGQLTINEELRDLGEVYVENDGGIYLSAQTVTALSEITESWGRSGYDDSYLEELAALASEHEYVYLDNDYGFFLTEDGLDRNLTSAMSKLIVDFYTEAYADFTTGGRVRKIFGGYELELNLEQYIYLLDRAMGYALENEERFFDAYEKYVGDMIALVENNSFQTAAVDVPELTDEERTEYKEYLAQAQETLRGQYAAPWLKDFGKSSLRVFLKGSSAGSSSELEISLIYGDQEALNIKVQSTIREQQTEIRFPTNFISEEELERQREAERLAANVPLGAEIYFALGNNPETEDTATFVMWQLLREDYGSFYELEYLVDEQAQYYLPLRAIAEPMELELVWDAAARHSQPVIAGQTVTVEGIVQDGVFYIELSQFEKLGYLVEEANDGFGGLVILSQEDPAWEDWYEYLLGA